MKQGNALSAERLVAGTPSARGRSMTDMSDGYQVVADFERSWPARLGMTAATILRTVVISVAAVAVAASAAVLAPAASASPAGTFTEFPVPTTESLPAAIAAGPDGKLWF